MDNLNLDCSTFWKVSSFTTVVQNTADVYSVGPMFPKINSTTSESSFTFKNSIKNIEVNVMSEWKMSWFFCKTALNFNANVYLLKCILWRLTTTNTSNSSVQNSSFALALFYQFLIFFCQGNDTLYQKQSRSYLLQWQCKFHFAGPIFAVKIYRHIQWLKLYVNSNCIWLKLCFLISNFCIYFSHCIHWCVYYFRLWILLY